MTQGLEHREQPCLGALSPACQDQAALCKDEPGLSPAEGGLTRQPELRVPWEAPTGEAPALDKLEPGSSTTMVQSYRAP